MRVEIVLGSALDDSWILRDMAERLRAFREQYYASAGGVDDDGVRIEEIAILAEPSSDARDTVVHILNDELLVDEHPDWPWHRSIYTLHQLEYHIPRRNAARRAPTWQACAAIGVVNARYADVVRQYCPGTPVLYTPAGVDLERFRPDCEVSSLLQRFDVDPMASRVVGVVGRPYRSGRKRVDYLIGILLHATAEGLLSPDDVALFVGTGWRDAIEGSGPWPSSAPRPVVLERGVDCTYADYPGIYAAMDCLLVTSRDEGGPVCVLEALATGVPVVSTAVGVVHDVAHPDLVYLIPHDNLQYATAQLRRALEMSQEQRRAAAEDVRPTLPTWEQWCFRYLYWYEQIAAERRTHVSIYDLVPRSVVQGLRHTYRREASLALEKQYAANALHNAPQMQRYPGVYDLRHILESAPAVVVGAGPSLDQPHTLWDELRDERERPYLIVACDAAVPALIDHCVVPDVIVVADPSPRQVANFEAILHSDLAEAVYKNTVVAAATIIHPETWDVLNRACERVCVYNIYDEQSAVCMTLPDIIGAKGALLAGVLTSGMALQVANVLGCRLIGMAGHDLCYYDLDAAKGYARGLPTAKYSWQWQHKFQDLIAARDVRGEPVLTHRTFVVFLRWLDEYLRRRRHDLQVWALDGRGMLAGEWVVQASWERFRQRAADEARTLQMTVADYRSILRETWKRLTAEHVV